MQSNRPAEPPLGSPLAEPPRRSTRRDGGVAVAVSVAAHLAVVAALLAVRAPMPPPPQPSALTAVALVAPHRALSTPVEPKTMRPETAGAAPQSPIRSLPTPLTPPPVAMATVESPGLTEAELAGAATADGSGEGGEGSGSGGGGGCNMIRRLQAALRQDPLAQAAARSPGARGRAVRVWDGDWVQSGGEDGRGLAAVREAIVWEVGFAPPACRSEPMHGLVLLSLADGPGATRLAVGSGAWRWSDLLNPHAGGR